MVRKILFPIFSAFLLYRSFDLMNGLMSSVPADFHVGESILIAFLLALFITGVFAIPGFAYPTNKIIGSTYYKLKHPQTLTQLYKIMGVGYYKFLLLLLFWGSKKNRNKYFNGTRSGIENFIYQSKQSEFGHLGAFVSILVVSIPLVVKGYFILVFSMTLINIIGNLYPIILQRHHRFRIRRLIKYME